MPRPWNGSLSKRCRCRVPCSHPWWTEFVVGGVRRRLSTGCDARDLALAEAVRLRRGEPGGAVAITVELLMSLDIERGRRESRDPDAREATLRSVWGPLVSSFSGVGVDSITYDALVRYVGSRDVRGQTVARELAALRRGMGEARRRGLTSVVVQDWPRPRSSPRDPGRAGRRVDVGDMRAFLLEAGGDIAEFIEFAARTGLRRGELTRLRWGHVALTQAGPVLSLTQDVTKTATGARDIPIGAWSYSVVTSRHEMGLDPLFPLPVNYRRRVRQACNRLGLPPIKLRDMRKTFASEICEHVDIGVARVLLGHRDIRTTQRYVTSSSAAVRRAVSGVDERLRIVGDAA